MGTIFFRFLRICENHAKLPVLNEIYQHSLFLGEPASYCASDCGISQIVAPAHHPFLYPSPEVTEIYSDLHAAKLENKFNQEDYLWLLKN